MHPSDRAVKVAELQSILRTHPRLRLELLASISRLFREHQLPLEAEVLSDITLTLQGTPDDDDTPPPPPGPVGVRAYDEIHAFEDAF